VNNLCALITLQLCVEIRVHAKARKEQRRKAYHYLIPITYYLQPITYYLLPITYYLLLTTYYLLLITYHSYDRITLRPTP